MATLKKVAKKTLQPVFSVDDIGKMGREYAELSAQIKVLEERKRELADKIKSGAEQFGVQDDKGSYYLENDSFIMGKVAKKSFKIDQERATKVLESIGLGDVIDEVVVKTVNEDKLQKAVQDQRISLGLVEEFTEINVSYSISVKEKEALPEVEQTTLKAAKKK